jgi:N-acetylmuramoyl-L-alanine amidase
MPAPMPWRPAVVAGAIVVWAIVAHALVAPDVAPVVRIGGVPYVRAADLARLLGSPAPPPPRRGHGQLRVGAHRLAYGVDDARVEVDRRTLRLPAPVRTLGADVVLPVALVDSLARDGSLTPLVYDPARGELGRAPAGGVVRPPVVAVTDSSTRVTFALERARAPEVVGRTRVHFRVHFAAALLGALADSVPPEGLVRAVRRVPTADGTLIEFELQRAARSWRMLADPAGRVVTVEIARGPLVGASTFAAAPGEAPLHVIVLDPGHGGADAGMTVGALREKDLALALAMSLRSELERRLPVEVVLTRDDDRALSSQQRAEAANRVRADLVLSLHFDGVPGSGMRGVSAWCPAAPAPSGGTWRGAPLALLAWREVPMRHAAESHALAQALLEALARAGRGPARLRELLPLPLRGIDAPAVMIAGGMLTSPLDRAALAPPDGMRALAAALADGVTAWESR